MDRGVNTCKERNQIAIQDIRRATAIGADTQDGVTIMLSAVRLFALVLSKAWMLSPATRHGQPWRSCEIRKMMRKAISRDVYRKATERSGARTRAWKSEQGKRTVDRTHEDWHTALYILSSTQPQPA